MSGVNLNPQQLEAEKFIIDWLSYGSETRHFLLAGYPGTGKTFTLTHCLNKAEVKYWDMCVAAPTHKAKRVIQEYLDSVGLGLEVYTVHSLLGLGVDIDDDGKMQFSKSSKNKPIDEFDRIWIDECSMIDTELFTKLKAYGKRLLFTGDDNQLLPVKEKSFPVFDWFKATGKPSVTLTEPERYSGSIKDYVYAALEAVQTESLFNPDDHITFDDQLTAVPNWFKHWTANTNPEKVLLTYTNSDVDKINKKCRDYVYGVNAPEYVEGELLLTYAPINDSEGAAMISNGTEVEIQAVEPAQIVVLDEMFEAYRIKPFGYHEEFNVLAKGELKRWDKFLTALAADCKQNKGWYRYYEAKETFADVKPTYALTIHKSQGSGYSDVYVVNSFKWLKDASLQPRLHYVAGSRAKQRLFISPKA